MRPEKRHLGMCNFVVDGWHQHTAQTSVDATAVVNLSHQLCSKALHPLSGNISNVLISSRHVQRAHSSNNWSSGSSVRLGIERSRVRSPGGAKKWMHVCKYLPLLSCVSCYMMCLIDVSVCTTVKLRQWVSLAPLCGSLYITVLIKLRVLCYVHMMICVILYAVSCVADIV